MAKARIQQNDLLLDLASHSANLKQELHLLPALSGKSMGECIKNGLQNNMLCAANGGAHILRPKQKGGWMTPTCDLTFKLHLCETSLYHVLWTHSRKCVFNPAWLSEQSFCSSRVWTCSNMQKIYIRHHFCNLQGYPKPCPPNMDWLWFSTSFNQFPKILISYINSMHHSQKYQKVNENTNQKKQKQSLGGRGGLPMDSSHLLPGRLFGTARRRWRAWEEISPKKSHFLRPSQAGLGWGVWFGTWKNDENIWKVIKKPGNIASRLQWSAPNRSEICKLGLTKVNDRPSLNTQGAQTPKNFMTSLLKFLLGWCFLSTSFHSNPTHLT